MRKILLLIISIILLTGCNKDISRQNVETYSYNMFYMDTHIEVKLYDITKDESDKLFKEIDNIYSTYHKLTDRYNEYENVINVYNLNRLKVDEEAKIDPKLSEIIEYGLNAYKTTNGYVNIAIGNVIDMWKSAKEEGVVPKIFNLMDENISIKYVSLNDNIYKRTGDITIDLGAYAKGFVTELVGKYLEDKGCSKYLINAGGNVKVGNSYKKGGYLVGLEEPFNTSNIYKTLKLENESVVTSGSYQRYYEVDNKIYSHIINPNTLFPDNYTKSVTIITKDSGYADILSTYMFMLPIEDGIKIIDSLDDVEAIWYSDKLYYSKGFSKYE